MDGCKKYAREVDEKKVEKRLIGCVGKVGYKGDKGYYRFQ